MADTAQKTRPGAILDYEIRAGRGAGVGGELSPGIEAERRGDTE